jgi:hypothetical protein
MAVSRLRSSIVVVMVHFKCFTVIGGPKSRSRVTYPVPTLLGPQLQIRSRLHLNL